MVQAINFVVRNSAGEVVRGAVSGDGGNFVQMGVGEEISLNLARESVAGYVQQGNDLVITLTDGRTITLSGYFTEGEPNLLYLSQNGEVIAVDLAPAGDGTMYASYGATDNWDKFSTLDDLRFGESDNLALASGAADDEPAGMAAFLPGLLGMGGIGAGVAGVGVIGVIAGTGGGGGGGGGGGPAVPTINSGGATVTTNTPNPSLGVSGTGAPGDSVAVTIGGVTQTTVIGTDGTWGVTFPRTGLPADGTHVTTAVVTHPTGTPTTLTGPTFILDMTPPAVEVTDGTRSTGDIENLAEHADGVTITGEGEPGASISVVVGTHTQTATVGPNGTWTVTFTPAQVPGGEYEIPMVITATDPLGNRTVLNDVLVIDTVPPPITFNPVTSGNTVNGAESTDGFAITGTSQPGATVSITLQGVTQPAVAGADGVWTINWAAGTLTGGEYTASISATSTDAAGNATTSTHSFTVDTTTSVAFATASIEGDNVVNAVEAADGVTLTGMAQAGSTVSIAWNNTTLPATVAADGSWTVTFPASAIPVGSYASTATVTATDAAGNTATATRSIQIDTDPNAIGFDAVTSGNVVNNTESAAGFMLAGTGTAGANITVTLQNIPQTVRVGEDGRWSVNFAAGQLAAGEYDATITATSTDAAGNPSTGSHTFRVDTSTSVAFAPAAIEGDNVINAAEATDGVTLTGMTQAGTTNVSVAWNNTTLPATVAPDGSWTVTFPASVIPMGNVVSTAVVTATDPAGNVATASRSLTVDTDANSIGFVPVTADNMVNDAEADAGFQLAGTGTAGATITVTLQNIPLTTLVGQDGRWSVSFAAGQLAAGEYDATLTATSMDAAGNPASGSHTFRVDTTTSVAFAPAMIEGNDIVNAGEAADGVTLAGITQPGTTNVSVAWNGLTLPASVAPNGSWTVTFPASSIPASTAMVATTATVTAIDPAGNLATATRTIQVDTGTSVSINAGQMSDNLASGSERSAGITFTGQAEANASVSVTFENGVRTVSADRFGNWSADFTSADFRSGSYESTISVVATDAAGNTAPATHAVRVDTEVSPFSIVALSSGTNGINRAEAEAATGVQVTGTVEPFSSVTLTFGSAPPITVSAGGDGNWTATIPTSSIPPGEATVQMTAVATDRYGNISAPVTQSVVVDRVVSELTRPGGNITADDVLNTAERSQGLTLGGTVEPNSVVVVTLSNNATQTVSVGTSGTWSVTFPAASLPTGNGATVTATIRATDSFANTHEITEEFRIDTVAPNAPLITDLTENVQGGITSLVTSGNGIFDVIEVTASGAANELTISRNYDSLFNDTTNRFTTAVPDGSYLVVRAEDEAGNQGSTLFIENSTGAITVDLGRDGLEGLNINVIDLREAAQTGLTITEAQLRELTGPDDRLVIMSDGDDRVTALGAVDTGQTAVGPDGQSYSIYTMGSTGATLLLDDDIVNPVI